MTRLRADPAFVAVQLRRSRQRYSAQARIRRISTDFNRIGS